MADLAGQMVAAQSAPTTASSPRVTVPAAKSSTTPVVQGLKAASGRRARAAGRVSKRVVSTPPRFCPSAGRGQQLQGQIANELNTATRGVGATAGAARQRFNELSAAFERQKQSAGAETAARGGHLLCRAIWKTPSASTIPPCSATARAAWEAQSTPNRHRCSDPPCPPSFLPSRAYSSTSAVAASSAPLLASALVPGRIAGSPRALRGRILLRAGDSPCWPRSTKKSRRLEALRPPVRRTARRWPERNEPSPKK